MTKEEIKDFIKENLILGVKPEYDNPVIVYLSFVGEEPFTSEFIYIPEDCTHEHD